MIDKAEELAEALGGGGGSSVKGFTHGRILRAIAQQVGGDGSRKMIADNLDISAATVSKSITRLTELGLVADRSQRSVGPGRPMIQMSLTRNFAVIGVAILAKDGQPDKLVGTVTSLDGQPFEGFSSARETTLKADARTDPRVLVEQLGGWICDELAGADIGKATLLGCGISISGHIDPELGVISREFRYQPKTEEAKHELEGKLEEIIGLPVIIDNDVTSLAVRNNLRPIKDESPIRELRRHRTDRLRRRRRGRGRQQNLARSPRRSRRTRPHPRYRCRCTH